MKILIKIILFAIFILIGIIIIFGIVYNKPNPKPISILINQSGQTRQNCTVNPVTCDTTEDCVNDCLEASEGLEMICKDITRTPEQEKIYGKSTKICTDASAKMECNIDLGGILVYSGSAGDERMEWDCICSYPEYAGSDGCKTINADVCGGPSNKSGFNWTIASGDDPSSYPCDCPDGKTLITTDDNKPICVPSSLANWYSDLDTVDTKDHCLSLNHCSGKGKCNTASNTCTCFPGYTKDDCSEGYYIPPNEVYFYDISNDNSTRYAYTSDQIDAVAKTLTATVATMDQLYFAQLAEFDVCSVGWCVYDETDNIKLACTVISTDWSVSGCNIGVNVIDNITKAGIFLYGKKPSYTSPTSSPYIASFSKTKWSQYEK